MKKPFIYLTHIEDLEKPLSASLLQELPSNMQEEVLRYRKNDDQVRVFAGKKLLLQMMQDIGFGHCSLASFTRKDLLKPYIPNFHPFNITHSGNYVACATFEGYEIGIDIEKKRALKTGDFTKQFSLPEMQIIQSASDQIDQFFEFWTQKEAVMKADGRGMKIPLHSIRLKGDYATIDDRPEIWHLFPIPIHSEYKMHACSTEPIHDIELHHIQIL